MILPAREAMHVYEIRPRKDRRGVDLIPDALPFGRLWYEDATAAVDHAKHSSRSHDAVLLKTPRLRSEESLANPILRIAFSDTLNLLAASETRMEEICLAGLVRPRALESDR
jgi:hypothetical protein